MLGRITLRRARVLRLVAEDYSEREIAERLMLSLPGVRSHIEDLKRITGHSSKRALGRWWRSVRSEWVRYLADEAGFEAHTRANEG